MEQDVQRRFEVLVDRSGEHHLWTGAIHRSRKTGRVKVQGREMTAHRLAWELAHGPLPGSVKVLPCPDVPACVRVDHLRVDRSVEAGKANRSTSRRGHGRRGGGSTRHHDQLLARHVDELAAEAVRAVPVEPSPATQALLQRLDRLQHRSATPGLSR